MRTMIQWAVRGGRTPLCGEPAVQKTARQKPPRNEGHLRVPSTVIRPQPAPVLVFREGGVQRTADWLEIANVDLEACRIAWQGLFWS